MKERLSVDIWGEDGWFVGRTEAVEESVDRACVGYGVR